MSKPTTTNEAKGEVLRPCPFCGGEGYPEKRNADDWLIQCMSCCARSAMRPLLDSAIELWNTRSHPTAEAVRGAAVELAATIRSTGFPGTKTRQEQALRIESILTRHFCHGDQRGGKRESLP